MVPRSMSTLQGSAGPMSLLGSSLIDSRGSLIGTGTGTGTGSAVSLPYLGPHSTSQPQLSRLSWRQQQQQQPSIAAVMGGSLASIAAGRGGSSSSSQGGLLMSTQSAVQTPAASAATGVISHQVYSSRTVGAHSVSAGDSYVVLPAAGSAVASGSGPTSSILSSSSVPSGSRGSLGSQAWPLIVSPSRAGNEDSSSYLTERNTIGSAVGGSSAETWHGQRDPTTLCETWLVTELCDRWVEELFRLLQLLLLAYEACHGIQWTQPCWVWLNARTAAGRR
jgi:hypothetical protein